MAPPYDPDVTTRLLALIEMRNKLVEVQQAMMKMAPPPQDRIDWPTPKIQTLNLQIDSLRNKPSIPLDPQAQERLARLLRELHNQIGASAAANTMIASATAILGALPAIPPAG